MTKTTDDLKRWVRITGDPLTRSLYVDSVRINKGESRLDWGHNGKLCGDAAKLILKRLLTAEELSTVKPTKLRSELIAHLPTTGSFTILFNLTDWLGNDQDSPNYKPNAYQAYCWFSIGPVGSRGDHFIPALLDFSRITWKLGYFDPTKTVEGRLLSALPKPVYRALQLHLEARTERLDAPASGSEEYGKTCTRLTYDYEAELFWVSNGAGKGEFEGTPIPKI